MSADQHLPPPPDPPPARRSTPPGPTIPNSPPDGRRGSGSDFLTCISFGFACLVLMGLFTSNSRISKNDKELDAIRIWLGNTSMQLARDGAFMRENFANAKTNFQTSDLVIDQLLQRFVEIRKWLEVSDSNFNCIASNTIWQRNLNEELTFGMTNLIYRVVALENSGTRMTNALLQLIEASKGQGAIVIQFDKGMIKETE